jgi:hypothetical protein
MSKLQLRKTKMTDDLELHDSWVELSTADGALTLRFCPGYIHHWEEHDSGWRGEGRSQAVDLVVAEGTLESTPIAGRFELSGGEISVGNDVYNNIIPVPIERSGTVHGRLESTYGDVVTFAGRALSA